MNDAAFGGIGSISRGAGFSFLCLSFFSRFSRVSEISVFFVSYGYEPIETVNYLARPVVFLDIEGLGILKVTGDAYVSAAAYASLKGGGLH